VGKKLSPADGPPQINTMVQKHHQTTAMGMCTGRVKPPLRGESHGGVPITIDNGNGKWSAGNEHTVTTSLGASGPQRPAGIGVLTTIAEHGLRARRVHVQDLPVNKDASQGAEM